MASDPNKRPQPTPGLWGGRPTPEPSAEPEQAKSVQPTSQGNGEREPMATVAVSSTQTPPDTNPGQSIPAETNPTQTSPAESNPTERKPAESNPTQTEPKESKSSAKDNVSQATPPTNGSSQTGPPAINSEPTDGAATEGGQPPTEASDLQAREIDRIMMADPVFAYKVLSLSGLGKREAAEEQYKTLAETVRLAIGKHPKASEALTKLDEAIKRYRPVGPVPTGAEFLNAKGEPMDTDGSNSLFTDSEMPDNTDAAASYAKEAWPWTTGLTHDGKRIMAYRTHGKGHRAIVELKTGSELFHIRSGMECGAVEIRQYLAQEGIRELSPPATRRKWSYEYRDKFGELLYLATSDYKTHNTDSRSGGRGKDPEAWAFVKWEWGFEEITVSDLRKVIGRESADAAIRAIRKKNDHTPPMEQQPQQIIVKAKPGMFMRTRVQGTQLDTGLGKHLPYVSGSAKPAIFDVASPAQRPETSTEPPKPAAGLEVSGGSELSAALAKINEKLDLLGKRVDTVDKSIENVTMLAQIVAKLAEKVGLNVDS